MPHMWRHCNGRFKYTYFFQIGGIEITAARNKYGRQYESFETELELHDSSLIGTGKHAPSDELVNSLALGDLNENLDRWSVSYVQSLMPDVVYLLWNWP